MEDPRISQQDVAQPLSGNEALPIVQGSAITGNLRTLRTDINALKDYILKNIANTAYPAGVVIPYASNIVDSSIGNWLLCDGRSVAISMYPKLYASIGKRYGSANNDSFNLPNLQGRVIIGYCNILPWQNFNFGNWHDQTYVAVGSTGGIYSDKLLQSQVPVTFFDAPVGSGSNVNPIVKSTSVAANFVSTMQPYMALNYIIKY